MNAPATSEHPRRVPWWAAPLELLPFAAIPIYWLSYDLIWIAALVAAAAGIGWMLTGRVAQALVYGCVRAVALCIIGGFFVAALLAAVLCGESSTEDCIDGSVVLALGAALLAVYALPPLISAAWLAWWDDPSPSAQAGR